MVKSSTVLNHPVSFNPFDHWLMLILEVVAWIKPGLEESLRHLAPLRRPKKKKLFSFGFFAEVPKLIPVLNPTPVLGHLKKGAWLGANLDRH